MFANVLSLFNKNRKKTFCQTHFQDLTLSWKLEDFPLILHKPTFITYLEVGSGFKFSAPMLENIYQAIEHLQKWFDDSNMTAQKYLSELDNVKDMEKSYLDFLSCCYFFIREFISQSLIPWIFELAFAIPHKENKLVFNSNTFFKCQQESLVFNFQKQLQKILKLLLKKQVSDPTFVLLNQAYLQKSLERKKTIKFLKEQAKIETEI